MAEQPSADAAAQNNTQADGTQSDPNAQANQQAGADQTADVKGSVNQNAHESNVSAQEESTRQQEVAGEITDRTEADKAKAETETAEKGVFSDKLADEVADAAEGKADASADDTAKSDKDGAVDYTDFSLPEGVNLNEGAMKDFLPLAKDAKLTQEQAQKFVDIGGRLAEESIALQEQAHKSQTQEWIKASFKHPELGDGKREQYKEAMGFADKAMRAFGDKELVQTLIDTGLVHNPSLVLYFKKAGQAISEDTLVTDRKTGRTDDQMLRSMYPATKFDD